MAVKQIGAEAAHNWMESDSNVVYIDVRTPQEFERGHPPRAINIPVVFPKALGGPMTPNPNFLRVVEAHVSKDSHVIVGCEMGGRSQMAAEVMDQAGFSDVSNMQGGFGGARDPMGQVRTPGWLQMEYPVEQEVSERNGYEHLKQRS